MKRTWKYIYLCWGILCLIGGYREITSKRTPDFEMSWSFIVLIFLFFSISPLANIKICRLFGVELAFRRPSLDRPPLDRGKDPLQTYRVFLVSSLLISLGAGFAAPKADHDGMMTFFLTAAMCLGLFVGERLIYLVHAKEIT